jgi:hypothetical protein
LGGVNRICLILCHQILNLFPLPMNLDFRVTFINDQPRLKALSERLNSVPALALDIETINWWNPQAERISLIQVAYRAGDEVRCAVIDALGRLDTDTLRRPLELDTSTKVMHNASFDAVRLMRHFKISAAPVHDTLLAARRSGEKRCSLKAQVEQHLRLPLDKSAQRSDWSMRPLSPQQLSYAALDAAATLLLYEHQLARGLRGDYSLRTGSADVQDTLPLGNVALPTAQLVERSTPMRQPSPVDTDLSAPSLALLGIICELPSRYGPEQLAVSVGADRVGLAGWIIDRMLGGDADLDEASAKAEIAGLCQGRMVEITSTRRLEASEVGRSIWQKRKAHLI